MRAPLRTLLLSAFLAPLSAQGGPPGVPDPAPGLAVGGDGRAEALALVRDLDQAMAAVGPERAKALKRQRVLEARHLDRQLEALAARSPDRADQVSAVRLRLIKAWQEDYAALARPWPVEPRHACRMQSILLHQAIEAGPGRLQVATAEARACLDKLQLGLGPLVRSGAALAAAEAEATAVLGSAGSGVGGPAPKGGAPPDGRATTLRLGPPGGGGI